MNCREKTSSARVCWLYRKSQRWNDAAQRVLELEAEFANFQRQKLRVVTAEQQRARAQATAAAVVGRVGQLKWSSSANRPDVVRYPTAFIDRVRDLAREYDDDDIAALLNRDGLRSSTGKPFTNNR